MTDEAALSQEIAAAYDDDEITGDQQDARRRRSGGEPLGSQLPHPTSLTLSLYELRC